MKRFKPHATAAMIAALAGAANAQISENFESTTAGLLPSGWSSFSTGAGSPWMVVSDQSNSAPNSVFTNDPGSTSGQYLDTPAISALGPVRIDFWRRYQVENLWDGWVVEVSINSGPFTNIGDAAFILNGYNATLNTSANPLSGQRGFSGTATTWTQSRAAIAANNGDQVVVRFHMGADGSVSSIGVWLDDISITTSATGVCCRSDGTCALMAPSACTSGGGQYSPALDCASANCPQPGACCYPSGTCTGGMLPATCASGGGIYRGGGTTCASVVCGIGYPETEPNETRFDATVVNFANPSDFITGTTTGTNTFSGDPASLDQFLVKVPAKAPGIYRNRLTLSTGGAPGHTGSIRAFGQIAPPAGPWPGPVGTPNSTDNTAQASSTTTTPQRFNQWYGFGKQEQFFYRITGTTSTTAPYASTFTSDPVTPTDLGAPFQPGVIDITTWSQGHTTDTEMWVYDGNFNAIDGFGNDDESAVAGSPGAGGTLQSFLRRDYAAGTYYVAISSWQLSLNKGSPCDDDYGLGMMLDFPDIITNSVTATSQNVSFAVTDSTGTRTFAAMRPGAYDVAWFKLTVGSACYANCDQSTQPPVLNVQDFSCFLTRYAAGESYANCDDSTQPPVLNVQDFSCFLTRYAAGCP